VDRVVTDGDETEILMLKPTYLLGQLLVRLAQSITVPSPVVDG
jgi:hypothetical protein